MRRAALTLTLLNFAATAHAQTVHVEWSTKGDPRQPFGEIAGAVALADGTVIVSDERNAALFAVSAEARSVTMLARSGSGPGEVRLPTLLARASIDGFAVYDLNHRAVLFYAADGTPRDVVQLQRWVTNPKGFAVLSDGSIVLSGGMFGSGHSIHHFGRGGDLLQSMYAAPNSAEPDVALHIAGGPVHALRDGGFLYSNSAPHEIRHYGEVGDDSSALLAGDASIIESVAESFYRVRVVDGRRVRSPQWWYAQSRGVYRLGDGTVLNVITREYEGDSIWERWEQDGSLLARFTVPRAYRPWDMTARGTVVASYRDPDTDEPVLAELRIAWE